MKSFDVVAVTRDDYGTNNNKRLRKSGYVPGVVYGGTKDLKHIKLSHKDLIIKLKNERFNSSILNLSVGKDKKQSVLLREVQFHPWRKEVLHVDFQRVSENKEINVSVPIHFINEDICIGVKQGGGLISHILNELEIICLPQDLPEFIEVDLEKLELGNSIHISQISLPKGVKSLLSQKTSEDPAVVAVQAPKVVADTVDKEAEATDAPDTTAENKESSDSDSKKEDAKE